MSLYKTGIWAQSSINERLLPEGYTQIEYLESTGTQWIDSNVIMSEKISYEAEGSIIEQTNTSDAAFCGTRDTGDNNTRFVTWWNDHTVTGGRINQSYYINGDSANYVTEYAKKYKISMKNKVFSINDTVQKVFTGTVTNPNNLTFALFALKYNATTTDNRRFKGRIYYFKIWNENILIRDFIPALRNSDNVAGLYDIVNNIFYTNEGSGAFKYVLKNVPSDYAIVEYIQSSGTQYIDSGISGVVDVETNILIHTTNGQGAVLWAENSAAPWGCSGVRIKNTTWEYGRGPGHISGPETAFLNTKYNLKFNTDLSNYYLKVNGKTVLSGTNSGEISSNNLYIFACNGGGTAKQFGKYQLYDMKIYQNGNLIRNFIPCYRVSDNVAGLYDTVNSTFYTNNGTGTFSIGDFSIETDNVKIYKDDNSMEANSFIEI